MQEDNTPTPDHAHQWEIEPVKKDTSKGICKICKAEKDFYNHASTAWGKPVDANPHEETYHLEEST